MNTITTDDVKYVAALAKIAITDEEAKTFTKELDAILGYVRQLDSIDTTDLEPTYQVNGVSSVMRPDEIINYKTDRLDLLKNAPHERDGFIEVPKVL